VIEFNVEKNIFEKVIQETFGKSGIRRGIPGQYLASDPHGRAVMIGAMERCKFVYILNRNQDSKLTISSPLESHKNSTVCSCIVAMDVGYENPLFASIEVDFSESDTDPTSKAFEEIEKNIIFYELDLGLNHVVRKNSIPVDMTCHYLIALPGDDKGPSGVLACSEGFITWIHEDYPACKIDIPKRVDPLLENNIRKEIIVTGLVHRLKGGFFVLLQTDLGDVFKLTMDYITNGVIGGVTNMKLKYFETLSVSTGMCLLTSGFLFSASEFGNHRLYQVENLGDDDTEQQEFDCKSSIGSSFIPRKLRNLGLVDEIESMSPLIDATVANLTEEDTPQIYALCGKGAQSTFRILRHGFQVSEIASTELPGSPNAVWTVRGSIDEEFDSYIILSFVNATLVLSVGETVEEVADSGILVSSPTICIGQLGEDALIQVYPGGIRHIRADKRLSEWSTPAGTHIVCATSNIRQVIYNLHRLQSPYQIPSWFILNSILVAI
jgi:splicing factor 3B subunit 3